jgi:lipid II isoglutaminyl synthase (glutamine-hydrolysing)
MNLPIIAFGKSFSLISKKLNLGDGSTWPGHIALKQNPNFISDILKKSKTKVIIIAGTNGKTTTGRLITSIVRENRKTYLQNKSGANLLNGLASTLIRGVSTNGRLNKDYLIFECDENALPQVIKETNPNFVICINLFRDQLDRYGEINSISKKWQKAFKDLTNKTTLILNADDPQIAFLSKNTKANVLYFGLNEKGQTKISHGADSIYCPNCNSKLGFKTVFFSHLGIWKCTSCGFKRPVPKNISLDNFPLVGMYNKYNGLAAALFANAEKFSEISVKKSFTNFTPAFGRQEKLIYKNRSVQLFLSKNPTSFNESISTIKEIGGTNLLIILNDNIPDGLDVSWIWDINLENLLNNNFNISVSGERVYDLALRFNYASIKVNVVPNIEIALQTMIEKISANETLYILPNYSAMLDIRKILTGKKIL